ncbi:MAG: D-alanyl-D-alanine carboxypeptidase/D-alanyl-D-alanine-endopeptidase [Desulfomonile tiedjei]|nr:D-alanyl-D-alanine carboxypeptidase/D-alanyl-D-alanine-endopeptidase [Desulfomonile tiedjei]
MKHAVISTKRMNMLELRVRGFGLTGGRRACALGSGLIEGLLNGWWGPAQAMLTVLAVLTGLSTVPVFASSAPPFNTALARIVSRTVPEGCAVSIQVMDLETGRVLMEKEPNLPLAPASAMKVVTSAAALDVLKPEFTFLTKVAVDGLRRGSVGTIYLQGHGDPYLVTEELFALTREVKDKGVMEVRGDIVVDDSYFVPSKPLDENEKLGVRSYHAPYSALSLNFNSLKILVQPGARPGLPASVTADPISEYAVIKADVKTVKGNRPAELEIAKGSSAEDREEIQVKGVVGVQAPVKGRYVNVSAPSLYVGTVFKEFLLREGIRVNGRVRHGAVPESAEPLVEFNSRPLGLIVYGLNKFSNNFMAEQICMAMGAAVHGAPGTREKGLAVIRKFLVDSGVEDGAFQLSEASGLSRNNKVTSAALVRVLRRAALDFTYGPEYMASFGIAGTDGTLKEKFTDTGVKRRIRAKTGTLRGVNALAGYGVSREGRMLVFAVIVNSLQKGAGFLDCAENIMRAVLDIPLGQR